MLLLTLNGCATVVSDSALAAALRKPMDDLAATHIKDDVPDMRRSARNVIAVYDKAVGK